MIKRNTLKFKKGYLLDQLLTSVVFILIFAWIIITFEKAMLEYEFNQFNTNLGIGKVMTISLDNH